MEKFEMTRNKKKKETHGIAHSTHEFLPDVR